MLDYRTALSATKQVFDPSGGQRRLAAPAPLRFGSPAATQHAQDVYRSAGQAAAVDFGRRATEAQNAYYNAARRAQDQSVLGGLTNLAQEESNRMGESQATSRARYAMLNDIFGGVLGGLF